MPISKSPELIRQIIMDNYQNPKNKGLLNNKNYILINLDSPNCIDNLNLQVNLKNKVIQDIRFDGEACAISTASTSILIKMMIGKTIKEANFIIDNFLNMLYGREYDEKLLEEAVAFVNTYKQPNRIKCATLSWEGLKEVINNKEEKK